MGPARCNLVEEAKVMRMNETGSGMIKAKERRGWSKRMAAHRALEKMQKEYKATRALVMMVERRVDLLLNILGLKYSPLGCVWGGSSDHSSRRDMFHCCHDVSRSRPELWSRVSRVYQMPDNYCRHLYRSATLEVQKLHAAAKEWPELCFSEIGVAVALQ